MISFKIATEKTKVQPFKIASDAVGYSTPMPGAVPVEDTRNPVTKVLDTASGVLTNTAKRAVAGDIFNKYNNPVPSTFSSASSQALTNWAKSAKELDPVIKTNSAGKITSIEGGTAGDQAIMLSPIGAMGSLLKDSVKVIAVSKDANIISKWLRTLKVPEEKIPNLSTVLTNVDKPKVVEDIIKNAIPTKAPKTQVFQGSKIASEAPVIEKSTKVLPQNLQERLDYARYNVSNMEDSGLADRVKSLEKYIGKTGEFRGELNFNNGKGMFGKRGDQIIAEQYANGASDVTGEELAQKFYTEREALRTARQALKDAEVEARTFKPSKADKVNQAAEAAKIAEPSGITPPDMYPASPAYGNQKTNQISGESTPLFSNTAGKQIERQRNLPQVGEIPQSVQPVVNSKEVPSYNDSLTQRIIKSREEKKANDLLSSQNILPIEFPKQAQEARDIIARSGLADVLPELKDLNALGSNYRNIFDATRTVFGKYYPIIDKNFLEPFRQSKGALVDFLEREKTLFRENIKFKAGSKEDIYIKMYGEGKVTIQELTDKFGEGKAIEIIKADSFFRVKYNEFLTKLNKVEQEIYPNSPYKWTPARKDYYRGFEEVSNNYSRLQNILENPVKIDSMIAGKSEEMLPKSKWQSFKQRRFGPTKDTGAIVGYLNYLPSVGYATHIDPHIGKFQELTELIRRGTQGKNNLNHYLYKLENFHKELAGKTNPLDVGVQNFIGRRPFAVLNWMSNQVKVNTILGNASMSLAQLGNITAGIADAGKINTSKAILKTIVSPFSKNTEASESIFLKERFFKGFSEFDKGMLKNTKNMLAWMVQKGDEVGTRFIWNTQYEKALQEGVDDAVKYADDATRDVVGGRGIGEKPITQNSKAYQLAFPFQYEMTQLWFVMEKMAKSDKSILSKMDSFATLFLSLYIFNNLYEKTTGQRLLLDPIKAIKDGLTTIQNEPKKTKGEGYVKAGGRLFGEALSNLPAGSTLASTVYPEYGNSVLPTRKELFGKADPTRFGNGILATKVITDPYNLLPFGGKQLKKSVEANMALNDKKVKSSADKFLYKVKDTNMNRLKGTLFGKQGLSETNQYYNKESKKKKGISFKIAG